MYTLSSDILSLLGEPAALLQNRRLVFANNAAKAILGEDCDGKGIRELFGDEVAEAQAPSFVAALPVGGRRQLLRFSRYGAMQIVFFSVPDSDSSLFSDAYLQALRNGLMNLNLAVCSGRAMAEELAHDGLRRCFAGLNKEYYVMNRLLANVSAVRSILADDLPMTLSSVDLGAIISDMVDSVSLLRPDVAIDFTVDRRILLWADPQLLELMLMNLLSNCLTHAIGLQHISIDLKRCTDRVYLTVKDDGCGIPPEKMSSLFHRYRSCAKLTEIPLGIGLGMTVIRGVTEAHGGALMLESREGAGTMVRISISRGIGVEAGLRDQYVPYRSSMDRLLTGLATCLPEECYSGKYLD